MERLEHVDMKKSPVVIYHPNGTNIYLPCLIKTSDRFVHDLNQIYEAIMLDNNRFFLKAYNKDGEIELDLKKAFDILNEKPLKDDALKECKKMRCIVNQREDISVKELGWVENHDQPVKDDDLIMLRYKFLAEPKKVP